MAAGNAGVAAHVENTVGSNKPVVGVNGIAVFLFTLHSVLGIHEQFTLTVIIRSIKRKLIRSITFLLICDASF